MAIDGVDSSPSTAASVRQAQETQASHQVGAQQAQQQAQQAGRTATPTTTQEVASTSQAARLERGAQSIQASGAGERSGGDPAQPGRTSQRLAQANSGDVQRALQRADQQRPSGTPQPGDSHLRTGDH